MKKGRSIVKEIRSSETFGALNYEQRDLFQGLIEVADDQGRMVGVATAIRSYVWAYDDITAEEVQADLNVLAGGEDPFIKLYKVAGKTYLQIVNWWTYQPMNWAQASAYPAPEGWTDRVRYQAVGGKIISNNWDKPGGFAKQVQVSTPLDTDLHSPLCSGQDTGLIKDNNNNNHNQKEKKLKVKLTPGEIQIPILQSSQSPQSLEKTKSAWNMALGDLRKEMSRADFETWVKPTIVDSVDGSRIKVLAGNSYSVDWLTKRVKSTLERSLQHYLVNPDVTVEFGVNDLAFRKPAYADSG